VLGQRFLGDVFKPWASAPSVPRGIELRSLGGTLLLSLGERLRYRFRVNWEKDDEFTVLSKNEENSVFWCIGWTSRNEITHPLLLGAEQMQTPATQELPGLIILCFFSCQEYFCVCRKIPLPSRNISLCRAWNRCVCCNIDCEHWHRMWFSFLPFVFEANWFHPAQGCLARRSYSYFHSGWSANGVIYITWNKLSWLRGLQKHIGSTRLSLAGSGLAFF